jgi:hypothetical protein
MLTAADQQQGFFDAAWCRELLSEDSISVPLAEHGERIVRDQDFANCYSERRGRPSGRWRRCGSICAGRSRWLSRLTIPGFTPRALFGSARGCCCTQGAVVLERSPEFASERSSSERQSCPPGSRQSGSDGSPFPPDINDLSPGHQRPEPTRLRGRPVVGKPAGSLRTAC